MKTSYSKTACSICNGEVETILDLGSTPLADHFLINENDAEEWYELKVQYCHKCGLAQLSEVVDDNILFKDDYGFFTSASPSAVTHFERYARKISQMFPKKVRHGKVLEIASNDGTFLKALKKCEANAVLGIDPATSVQKKANENGIRTIHDFFNHSTAEDILRTDGQQDIIIANNVMAHVDDLKDFAGAVSLLLKPDGVFIAEFQYFPDLISKGLFDNVYHEHRYFLGLKPVQELFSRYNLNIQRAEMVDTQGGSVRVFLSHGNLENPEVLELLKWETAMPPASLHKLQDTANSLKDNLLPYIQGLKNAGKTVYGYGASAKGNTLLNWCGITKDAIEHIVDKTPYKFDKFAPGSHIIVSNQDMMELPDYYLLLVHNYADSIVSRETYFTQQGGKFIVPLPTLRFI